MKSASRSAISTMAEGCWGKRKQRRAESTQLVMESVMSATRVALTRGVIARLSQEKIEWKVLLLTCL